MTPLDENLETRLLAAIEGGSGRPLDRAIEVWEAQTGSRKGLTSALLALQAAGRIQLDSLGAGDETVIVGVSGVVPAGTSQVSASASRLEPVIREPRTVFVVHGRDERLRASLFAFLRALDLGPVEWSNLVIDFGEGAPYIGQLLDHAFARAQAVVVLMSPEEQVELRAGYGAGSASEAGFQARPNVLFEAGMAIGREPGRTVVVEVGELRPFSDIAGRHVVRLDDRDPVVGFTRRQDLARRLGAMGCPVQMAGSDWHRVGDFRPSH
jgi:predicted nucleotide-binding protein